MQCVVCLIDTGSPRKAYCSDPCKNRYHKIWELINNVDWVLTESRAHGTEHRDWIVRTLSNNLPKSISRNARKTIPDLLNKLQNGKIS